MTHETDSPPTSDTSDTDEANIILGAIFDDPNWHVMSKEEEKELAESIHTFVGQ